MPKVLTCPQGHQWLLAADQASRDGPLTCPVCGGAVQLTHSNLLQEAGTATLPLPPAPGPEATRSQGPGPLVAPVVEIIPAELAEHTRYRILAVLGVGGMGAVYQAEHRLMERPVALKVIARQLVDDPAAVARFRREVKAAARLSHPNIVQAFDADQAGDLHFLVMEYVEGTDLARLIAERGPLPVARACSYIRQAALGLQHAFEHGMVHRDIKPHNLMRTPKGQIKILDFGLARFVRECAPTEELDETETTDLPSSNDPTGDDMVTQFGSVMGTADFIAPEQAQDTHSADIRADIYSLGCTLYYLLAGQSPFPDGSFADKLQAHRDKQPRPLSELRRDLPPPLLRILERMLAKDPDQRYQTPAEVAQALAPFTRKPGRRWWPWVAAGLVLVGLVFAGIRHGGDVLRFVANRGQIILDCEDPDARVILYRTEESEQPLRNLERGQPMALPAGDYYVELTGGPRGLQVVPSAFTLGRGRQVTVAVLHDEVRRFQGKGGATWSVAVTPDGRQALSAGEDGKLYLWDLATGRELRRCTGHFSRVYDVALSPDGRWALSASAEPDNSVRLWDLTTGQEVRRFVGPTGSVRKVAFSPDGRQFLSASHQDRTVRLWEVDQEKPHRVFPPHGNWVEGVAFSPRGNQAVSSSMDGTLRLWDLATGQFRELKGHQGGVMRVVYSPDGRHVLSGGDDGTLRLWDAETGRHRRTFLDRHKGRVEGVTLSPDGRLALSCSGPYGDRTLRLWDVERGMELHRFQGHGQAVNYSCAVFTPDGRQALTADMDGQVRLWRIPDAGPLQRLTARVPAPESRPAVRIFEGHTGTVRSVALSPDNRWALSASGTDRGDRTLRLWDVANGQEIRQFHGHDDQVQRIVFSPDGRQALSAGRNATLRLWDVASGQELRVFRGHTDVINTVTLSPDGRRALSGSYDGTLRLWDVASGQELLVLTGHTDGVVDAAISPDGRRALSGSFDRTLRLWDLDSGAELHRFLGHLDKVECVAFSPDGRRALSGSYDRSIRLWDLESKQELASWTKHRQLVTSVAFSRDGRRVLSASSDQTIRLWELEGGRELYRFEDHTGPIWTAVFSADERLILSGGEDKTLRLWEAPP